MYIIYYRIIDYRIIIEFNIIFCILILYNICKKTYFLLTFKCSSKAMERQSTFLVRNCSYKLAVWSNIKINFFQQEWPIWTEKIDTRVRMHTHTQPALGDIIFWKQHKIANRETNITDPIYYYVYERLSGNNGYLLLDQHSKQPSSFILSFSS